MIEDLFIQILEAIRKAYTSAIISKLHFSTNRERKFNNLAVSVPSKVVIHVFNLLMCRRVRDFSGA